MSKVDLHIHTNASDGRYTPREIVLKAYELGLRFIAITDHDTVNGVIPAQEAARAVPDLTVISGVEINTDVPSGELHLLGYFIDCSNLELKSMLNRLQNSRVSRAQRMVQKLNGLGIQIDFQRVSELAGAGAMGRPHVAQALLEKGYITSFREAFSKYIGQGGPAYVEREKITPVDAVKLVIRAGGLPVLAHPLTFDDPETWIKRLKAEGLVGIEAHYNSYSSDQIKMLLAFAARYNLIATGGSDFHGLDLTSETVLGGVEVPLKSAESLLALARR